ncbi:MAG TPA: cation:proton antiporter [Vicinamibacterales bacterium]|jgi:Kef-type K+ transport system membrane component KefB
MSHLPQLLLLLIVIIASAKLAAAASTRLGQPAVFGEIFVGLVLGPTVLNMLTWPVFAIAVPGGGHGTDLKPFLGDLSELGVILLMFVAGLETDVAEMRRVGRIAFWTAAGGVVLPLAGGAAVASAFGLPFFWEGLFIGTILTATSVSISAQTLMELGALRSREGATILGAAVIDDVMGIILLSLVVAFARSVGSIDYLTLTFIVARMAAFFVLAFVAARLLPSVGRWAERLGVSQGLLAAVLAITFGYAWAAEYVGGVAAITGAYLAGVGFGQTSFKSRIDAGIHPLTYSMLVPVFFVGIGLQANGRELGGHVLFTLAIVLVAIVAKAVGCGGAARMLGFTGRESVRVGAGMISRGEVGLIIASYGLVHGIIGHDVFSASVIMVLATTMVTPPLLRATFPRGIRPDTGFVEESIAGPPEPGA